MINSVDKAMKMTAKTKAHLRCRSQAVVEGNGGAVIALKLIEEKKFLAVVYKEASQDDGFVITACFTNKLKPEREVVIWQRLQ